jgi:predicted dehydrogenase
MGRIHARAYAQMPSVKLVGVYDSNPENASAAAAEYGTESFNSLEALLPRVRAVTIAAPTQHHLTLAEPFLRRGIACLIEKPMTRDVAEGKRLAALAREHSAVVQVGHIERFNPAIRAVSKLDLRPRFIEAHRVSPMTFRSIDVGVVLDLMIHDIDIILKFAGSGVTDVTAMGVSVVGDVEDVCNARITFANGCVANLTASRMALKTERKLRIFTPDAYVTVDYQKREAHVVRRGHNIEEIRDAAERLRMGEITDPSSLNFMEMIKFEKLVVDEKDPIRAELEAFIEAARTHSPSPVTAEDGLAAIEVAQRIIDCVRANSNV